ncbi:MAG: phosphoribosylamine--glycine ligase [bacterium]|jgi:phosphoribosylamine--glycine ligase
MNILVVGAGGREHALVWKCKQSPKVDKIFVTPGNGGIETLAGRWNTTDHDEIISLVKQNSVDLVIIGQDDYLVDGLVDKLEAEGIKVFGPKKYAAQLEGSKSFAKNFMKKYQIPTAGYDVFEDFEDAKQFLDTLQPPYVLKADGLAAGKGVLICENKEDAIAGLQKIMVDKAFGSAGNQVVIEEFLEGEEASFFIFTDGKDFVVMPTLQDHKRQLELDQGPNTGGMGCYSPAPIVTPEVEAQVIKDVVKPAIEGMASEGCPYKGVLYIGLMIDSGYARVVEFNSRFGDPECQPLMMLLDSDMVEIAEAVADENLGELNVQWKKQAAACVILASGGYPNAYAKGHTIQGLEDVESDDTQMVFHAGTNRDQNRYTTNGGRVLGVTTLGDDMPSALKLAYENANQISWKDHQYRRDIGLKGLKRMTSERKGEIQVAIVMGSISDKKIAEKATKIFDQFGIGYKVYVSSAHRTPERTREIISSSIKNGVEVIIAIAGMAAHLPGVIAADAQIPVIGVPVNSGAYAGHDAVLSVVQMPPGIPVATVGVDRGDNAAILAAQILGLKYPEIQAQHQEYRLEMEQKVIAAQAELDEGSC